MKVIIIWATKKVVTTMKSYNPLYTIYRNDLDTSHRIEGVPDSVESHKYPKVHAHLYNQFMFRHNTKQIYQDSQLLVNNKDNKKCRDRTWTEWDNITDADLNSRRGPKNK